MLSWHGLTVLQVSPADVRNVRSEIELRKRLGSDPLPSGAGESARPREHFATIRPQQLLLGENDPSWGGGVHGAAGTNEDGTMGDRRSGMEGDDPGAAGEPIGGTDSKGITLERRKVLRGTWKIKMPVCGLLVTTGPLDRGQALELVGLARVEAHQPGRHERRQWIDILQVELLDTPVSWVGILDRLTEPQRKRLEGTLRGAPERLKGRDAISLLDASSAEARLPLTKRLAAKLSRPTVEAAEEERDRVDRRTTLLRVSNMRNAGERPLSLDEVPQVVRSRWEGDFIKHDSRVIDPGWRRSDAADTWFLFEKNGRRLYVLESDARIGEQVTGGDLIYLRPRPAALVAVQYKRLVTSLARVSQASCPVDHRFQRQLGKLSQLSHPVERQAKSTPTRSTAGSFRLSASGGFVKLIESREKETQGHLYRGVYLPAEYVRLLLDEADDGSLNLDLERDRFIDPQTFVQLLSDSWIGTAASNTHELTTRLYASGFLNEDQPHTYAEELP